MSWLTKLLPPRIKSTPGVRKTPVPEGLWVKCPSCEATLYRTDLEKNLLVCPKCSYHDRVSARERIEQLLDAEGRFEIGSEVVPVDSLKFKDTNDLIKRANDTNFGLAAAIWTRDVAKAHRYAQLVRAGTIWINCYDVFDAAAPFGGFKESGLGRELGEAGLDNYLETKTVTVSLS